MGKGMIYFVEKNIRGAWVVCGKIGMRQYYYYTKKEAMKMYSNECRNTIIVNEK